ncbi:MAG TPA: methylated-DNA--[protein]-cysteine S-methyltransferase [Burkholderiaceae bacterium]
MISYTDMPSPVGKLTVAATERGLCGIYFEQHRHFKGKDGWQRDARHAVVRQAVRQIEEFFAGTREHFDLPLDLRGTPFQQEVWRQLLRIPYGTTVSYGEHARAVGRPKAARAVGAAIGRNPVSIIVPCHRVVGSNGSLTDYAGGLARKRMLLEHELRSRRLAA